MPNNSKTSSQKINLFYIKGQIDFLKFHEAFNVNGDDSTQSLVFKGVVQIFWNGVACQMNIQLVAGSWFKSGTVHFKLAHVNAIFNLYNAII